MSDTTKTKAHRLEIPLELEVLMHVSRLDGTSAPEAAMFFSIPNAKMLDCINDLTRRGFLMRTGAVRGKQGFQHKVTKEGINEIVRFRTLADGALRVRRSGYVSIDPKFA